MLNFSKSLYLPTEKIQFLKTLKILIISFYEKIKTPLQFISLSNPNNL